MLKGRSIVCVSSIDWDVNWQTQHELMSIFARNGNSVLYIENTGLRAPKLLHYDAERVADRLKHLFWRGLRGLRREGENLTIYTPLFFPWARGGMGRRINRLLWRKSLKEIKRTLRQDPILITWLPTPAALDLISALEGKGSVVIYYNLIDFLELSGGDEVIQRSERELLERADLVFAWTDKLCNYYRGFTRKVYRTYPSVNLSLFNPEAGVRRPPDLENLEGPLLGYTGALHKHLDVELLSWIAEASPGWQLVLVGLVATDVALLRRHSNVHLIHNQPHERIPSFLAAFDICLIPYRVWHLTETVVPTKLPEYLAMGKPVVSTDFPFMREFNTKYGELVRIARDKSEFLAQIEEALREGEDGARIAAAAKWRRSIASGYSWRAQAEWISGLIEGELAAKGAQAVP